MNARTQQADPASPGSEGSPRNPKRASSVIPDLVLWPRTLRPRMMILLQWWLRPCVRIDASVASFSLPPPVGALVRAVVRRTRLWRSERLDIARELSAHFADGIASGVSPVQLIADFGDPKRAAAMIRRAKIRCRPLWWKSLRFSRRAVAGVILLCILTYAYLAGRYYLSRPTIRRDFTAELNALVLRTPPAERAMPLYVRAMRELGPYPAFVLKSQSWPTWPTHPQDSNWKEARAYVASHADALRLIRTAASKPLLGYVYTNPIDPDFRQALVLCDPRFGEYLTAEPADTNSVPMLITTVGPYMTPAINFAAILRLDAADASENLDDARFLLDIDAILGIAEQCAQTRLFIDTRTSISIADSACDAVLEQLGTPGFLTDEELTRLAHRFAAFAGGHVTFDPIYERQMFEDLMQRLFTDDGHGDGYPIASNMQAFLIYFGMPNPDSSSIEHYLQPLGGAFIPSRAERTKTFETYFDRAQTDEAQPLWRRDDRSVVPSQPSRWRTMLFPFEWIMEGRMTSYTWLFAMRDLFEARRAAVLTACALESYHRSHGRYPPDLAALVPALLPSIPIDPFDGQPLRYRVSEDGATPLLYSIGVDQADDAGHPPADPKDREKVLETTQFAAFRMPASWTPAQKSLFDHYRGDWIIYPPLPASGVSP